MKIIKAKLTGRDEYGDPVTHEIEVPVYNRLERTYRAMKFGFMRLIGPHWSYRLGLSKFRYITRIDVGASEG